MSRYALRIEYDGTNYHGWQVQQNVRTVQEEIEKGLSQLTSRELRVTGSGRTDAGVHAMGQVAHFDESERDFDGGVYCRGLNSYTPDDILIKECIRVNPEFHARFDARQRFYRYEITLEPVAIGRQYTWQVYREIDELTLQKAATCIEGRHDFQSFQHAQSEIENSVCEIINSAWKTDGKRLRYLICGDRFLHNMVRCLVGTMIEVARNRFTLDEFESFIEEPDKNAPVVRAPAHGLFLDDVRYKTTVFSS